MRRKRLGGAVTESVTLHIIKEMVPVYTVEKPEVHPHAENFRPQVCSKPQQDLEPEEANSWCPEHLQHVMFTVQHADV